MLTSHEVVLEAENVTASRGMKTVLQSVSFCVRQGQVFYVLGRNGAGKSSLLLALQGRLPCSGKVTVLGQNVSELPRRTLAGLVGYVPQSRVQQIPFAVKEFLEVSRYPSLSGREESVHVIRDYMARLELEHLAEVPVRELSGGEYQRVALASALVNRPKLLLVDEPTASLDPQQQALVSRLLRQLSVEERCAVMVVTHSVPLATRHADMILALRSGEVEFVGPPATFSRQRCSDLYAHPFHEAVHGGGGAGQLIQLCPEV